MKEKLLSVMIVTSMLAGMMTGCGASSEGSSNSGGSASSVESTQASDNVSEKESELHIAIAMAPPTLDCMMGTEYMSQVISYGNIFESLVMLTEDYQWKEELC